jgi:two-component system, NtrC family, nitrogen regulation response regulator GlnG
MSARTDDSETLAPRKLVYIVDDDHQLRPLLERALVRAGFDVAAFPNAELALDALLAGETVPDLLVTDYQMPGMNGLELIARCREILPGLKTLSISGTPELMELKFPRCRPDTLLPKPFAYPDLIKEVRLLVS